MARKMVKQINNLKIYEVKPENRKTPMYLVKAPKDSAEKLCMTLDEAIDFCNSCKQFVKASNKVFACTHIKWDTDGHRVKGLPTSVDIFEDYLFSKGYIEKGYTDEEAEDILADLLSVRYGYCILSFDSKVIYKK